MPATLALHCAQSVSFEPSFCHLPKERKNRDSRLWDRPKPPAESLFMMMYVMTRGVTIHTFSRCIDYKPWWCTILKHGCLNRELSISDSNWFKILRIEWITISIAIQCFQSIYILNYYMHKLMETLNSVRASHLSFTRSTINRLSQDCVRLTDTFSEQLMSDLLVLVASNAIVK